MNNMILTQIPAQSTLEFYIIINFISPECDLIPQLSCRLSISSTKSSKSILSSYLSIESGSNATQSFTGHGIFGNCFHYIHFWKTSLARSPGDGKVTATSNNQMQLFKYKW